MENGLEREVQTAKRPASRVGVARSFEMNSESNSSGLGGSKLTRKGIYGSTPHQWHNPAARDGLFRGRHLGALNGPLNRASFPTGLAQLHPRPEPRGSL